MYDAKNAAEFCHNVMVLNGNNLIIQFKQILIILTNVIMTCNIGKFLDKLLLKMLILLMVMTKTKELLENN